MKSRTYLPVLFITAALLIGGISATRSQQEECRYFTETGHYVCGVFLQFFDERGSVEIFGYPLTEAFDDPVRGLRVQYFQRVRMEWHPYNPDPYKVQLGLLGAELLGNTVYPPANPATIPAFNSALHHYFYETGHLVSYEFLRFYREHGGLDIFGYPLSEALYENGYIVQYFQRARMEWHPEIVRGSRVRLTNLGELYIERFGLPGNYDLPLPPPRTGTTAGTSAVTRLNARATPLHTTTGRNGVQTIYVYVRDQRGRPVQGATVRIVVHYPQIGDQPCNPAGVTDQQGFIRCNFGLITSPSGKRVRVDVMVTYGNLSTSTQTYFLPWY